MKKKNEKLWCSENVWASTSFLLFQSQLHKRVLIWPVTKRWLIRSKLISVLSYLKQELRGVDLLISLNFEKSHYFYFTQRATVCHLPWGPWCLPFHGENIFSVCVASGPMVCQFTHMDNSHLYLAFQLASLGEWKKKPLGSLNTNKMEDATTHACQKW